VFRSITGGPEIWCRFGAKLDQRLRVFIPAVCGGRLACDDAGAGTGGRIASNLGRRRARAAT